MLAAYFVLSTRQACQTGYATINACIHQTMLLRRSEAILLNGLLAPSFVRLCRTHDQSNSLIPSSLASCCSLLEFEFSSRRRLRMLVFLNPPLLLPGKRRCL